MNGPFKGVSAGLWSYDDRGGDEPVRITGEMTEMLALMVLGAVVVAFILEATVVAFGADEV